MLNQKFELHGKTIENRIVFQPMEGFDCKGNGEPDEFTKRKYLRLAKGGAGILWFEANAVCEEGRTNLRQMYLTEENASVFELWKNGTGFSEIANILGSKPGTIFTMLRDTGGIKPHERKRAVAHLTLSEREEIRAGLSAKMSIRAIATALNRSPSTISREVQRNRGRRYYKAVDANNRANRMAKRPKPCLLDQNLPLRKLVLEKLEMKWSPEQISGWLRRTKPFVMQLHRF